MSEDYLVNDIPWDSEETVDREPESSGDGGRTHFGFLRLHALKVTKSWEKGHYITIPGVTGGQYNEKDGQGNMLFKGWDKGGNQWLFVLVATKEDKDGNSYQMVKQMPGKLPRKDDPHIWGDYALPSLLKLPKPNRDKLSSEGAYCQWSDVGTGHKVEVNGQEQEIKAWTNFTVYPSKEAMKQAETEFWASRNNNGSSGGVTGVFYPASWTKTQDGVSQMLTYAKSLTFTDHKDLANQLGLFGEVKEDGTQLTTNDVARVVLQITGEDIPVPLVEQALK